MDPERTPESTPEEAFSREILEKNSVFIDCTPEGRPKGALQRKPERERALKGSPKRPKEL